MEDCAADFMIDGIGYKLYRDEFLSVTARDSVEIVDMMECVCPPEGGILYRYRDNSGLLLYKGNVVIPDSVYVKSLGRRLPVKRISSYAFANCVELRSVTCLGEFDYIGEMAFAFCENLESVNLRFSDKMTNLPLGAFQWCRSLTEFDIPPTVTDIYGTTFFGSAIENLTIPAGMRSISYFVMAFGCNPHLKSLTCLVTDPRGINKGGGPESYIHYEDESYFGVKMKIPDDCVLYVPEESLEAYRADQTWSSWFREIRAIGDEPSELAEVTAEPMVGGEEPVYDLAGRRLTTTRPGQIVIRRGEKSVAR